MLGAAEQAAGAFNKNTLKAVDHDFRDGVVIDEILKDIEPADGIEQLLAHFPAVREAHSPAGVTFLDQLVNDGIDLRIGQITGHLDALHELAAAFLKAFLIHKKVPPGVGGRAGADR